MKKKYLKTRCYFKSLTMAKHVTDAYAKKGWKYTMYFDGDRKAIVVENIWYYRTELERRLAIWSFRTLVRRGNRHELKYHPERCFI